MSHFLNYYKLLAKYFKLKTKACCENVSNVVEGKFMEDIRKQLAALQATVQDQQVKIKELQKEVNSLKKDGKNKISGLSYSGMNYRVLMFIFCKCLCMCLYVHSQKVFSTCTCMYTQLNM